jgi:predicted lipase
MHEALMPQLLQLLESAPTRASVVVTGHSLGASLAVLAALNMTVERPDLPVPFMYDYGQPRVGNAAFVDMLHSSGIQMFRIINQHDIVPHIPPEAAGYKHMPTEVWWHNGTYQVCSSTDGEDKSCSNRIPELNPNDHPTYPPFPPGIDVTCGG